MLKNYEIHRKDPLLAVLKLCICTIALFLLGHYMPIIMEQVEQVRPVYDEPMMRVVASSNTAKDQQIKQQIVKDLQSIHYVNIENEEMIDKMAYILQEKYADLQIEMKTGDNLLPPKWLNGTFYPQGQSQSVVIQIGEGRGENWFCTVFPKACGKTERDKIRFKGWEWLKEKWS